MISVVIPTCNRNDLLAECLKKFSAGNQTVSESTYEIIVSDDSATNAAKAMMAKDFPWAKWSQGPKSGPAANRNNGAKHANYDWLVFIDDDVIPNPDLLENYSKAINAYPDSFAFEGSIVPDDWKLLKKEMVECPINVDGGYFWSANVAIKKQFFFEIGGFDEAFKLAAMEDQDIFLRLKEKTTVPFLKDCIVTHPVRSISLKRKIKALKNQFQNWMYFASKHNNKSLNRQLLQSIKNFIYISMRDVWRLNFRLMILHMISAFYCVRLIFSKKPNFSFAK